MMGKMRRLLLKLVLIVLNDMMWRLNVVTGTIVIKDGPVTCEMKNLKK